MHLLKNGSKMFLIIDRYLIKQLLPPLLACTAGFFIFWITFDLITEIDSFQGAQSFTKSIIKYYLLKSPELLQTTLPISLLLAMLYTATLHSRHQEYTAIRASGLSIFRISIPYMSVGLIFGMIIWGFAEYLIPKTSILAEQIISNVKAKNDHDWLSRINFVNEVGGRVWTIDAFNTRTGEALTPQIGWFMTNGAFRHIIAERAVYTNNSWLFFNVQEFYYPSGSKGDYIPSSTNILELKHLNETPEKIRNEIKIRSLDNLKGSRKLHLKSSDIREYLFWHPTLRPDKKRILQTILHSRISSAFTSIIVVIIALPFGMHSNKRNIFFGAAGGIFITFVFFILQEFSLALGAAGILPPLISAWLPNIFFGTLGIIFVKQLN
jgi:lipopolysaccharide export system permease protein